MFKKIIATIGMLTGAYWVGKVVGAKFGAKAVLDSYADVIPDDTFEIKLVDNKKCVFSTTAKKKEGAFEYVRQV